MSDGATEEVITGHLTLCLVKDVLDVLAAQRTCFDEPRSCTTAWIAAAADKRMDAALVLLGAAERAGLVESELVSAGTEMAWRVVEK
ncbi:MAG: hypothetical protein F4Y03_10220 [Alphaproteobacteria bacterium]|nr:hypothetical protein [Alphaproteobacteria bacterium]